MSWMPFIQNDRDWFEPRLAEHPAPPGIRLIPPVVEEE